MRVKPQYLFGGQCIYVSPPIFFQAPEMFFTSEYLVHFIVRLDSAGLQIIDVYACGGREIYVAVDKAYFTSFVSDTLSAVTTNLFSSITFIAAGSMVRRLTPSAPAEAHISDGLVNTKLFGHPS